MKMILITVGILILLAHSSTAKSCEAVSGIYQRINYGVYDTIEDGVSYSELLGRLRKSEKSNEKMAEYIKPKHDQFLSKYIEGDEIKKVRIERKSWDWREGYVILRGGCYIDFLRTAIS